MPRACRAEGAVIAKNRDLAELLEKVGLFSRCTKRERQTVARHSETASLPAGTDLVIQGEPGDALFVVIDGEVSVSRDGQELNRMGPGSFFGELAILDGEPRAATVTATTDVTIAVIGIRMFRTLLREFPEIAEQLLAGLAGELRTARGQASASADAGAR